MVGKGIQPNRKCATACEQRTVCVRSNTVLYVPTNFSPWEKQWSRIIISYELCFIRCFKIENKIKPYTFSSLHILGSEIVRRIYRSASLEKVYETNVWERSGKIRNSFAIKHHNIWNICSFLFTQLQCIISKEAYYTLYTQLTSNSNIRFIAATRTTTTTTHDTLEY